MFDYNFASNHEEELVLILLGVVELPTHLSIQKICQHYFDNEKEKNKGVSNCLKILRVKEVGNTDLRSVLCSK